MIKLSNVFKRYHNHHGSEWVLRDINFTIPTGTSVGVIGGNGAGKSTLLNLIANMDAPDRGEIVRQCRVSWPIGLSGGFQGSMTGRQNVKFVARIHGDEAEIERIVDYVEAFAEIGPAFDEPIKTYSSGMKSRLSFGLSLAFDFDVYLSDEATAVGDLAFKEKAKAAFRDRIGKAGLVMVSHSEGILKDLCQAGVWLHQGQAHWFEDVNDAIAAYHDSVGKGGSALKPQGPGKVEKLRAANQKLREGMTRQGEKINAMRESITKLKEDKKAIAERSKSLHVSVKTLREEKSVLAQDYRTLSEQYRALQNQLVGDDEKTR